MDGAEHSQDAVQAAHVITKVFGQTGDGPPVEGDRCSAQALVEPSNSGLAGGCARFDDRADPLHRLAQFAGHHAAAGHQNETGGGIGGGQVSQKWFGLVGAETPHITHHHHPAGGEHRWCESGVDRHRQVWFGGTEVVETERQVLPVGGRPDEIAHGGITQHRVLPTHQHHGAVTSHCRLELVTGHAAQVGTAPDPSCQSWAKPRGGWAGNMGS